MGALLLRVLLCLGLLVNGQAPAMAATQSLLARHQANNAAPPCHEAGHMKANGSKAHEHHADPVTKKPDCCKSGACECACHAVAVTMPSVHAHGRKVRHTAFVGLPVTRYTSPALPRLIRPPIV